MLQFFYVCMFAFLAESLEYLLKRMVTYEGRAARVELAQKQLRFGRIITRSGPHGVSEVWEDGEAVKELHKSSGLLLQRLDIYIYVCLWWSFQHSLRMVNWEKDKGSPVTLYDTRMLY